MRIRQRKVGIVNYVAVEDEGCLSRKGLQPVIKGMLVKVGISQMQIANDVKELLVHFLAMKYVSVDLLSS